MTVSTLDGYISFKDPGAEGAKEVALAHIPQSGSGADWRPLNAGWMFADAVIGSGAILRSEPLTLFRPLFDDLVEHRVNVLKKSKYPLNIILSGSGDIDLKHGIFHHEDLQTLIITTKPGYSKYIEPQLSLIDKNKTLIEILGDGESTSLKGEDFTKLMEILRNKYSVKFLDVTAGGFVIGTMVWHKLVDEMRVTIAGQVCGASAGPAGGIRPSLFQAPPGVVFDHTNNPLLQYDKIAVFGAHHIFVRALFKYRH